MALKWDVEVKQQHTVAEIDGAWGPAGYRRLLEAMDYGDTADLDEETLRELTVLSLQDRAPNEAAEVLLADRLGGRLKRGHIENLAHEMAEEKLWEHHADQSMHEDLFHVASLASLAFPGAFPAPDAARVRLLVRPLNPSARKALAAGLTEPLLVRLLADGMPSSAILRRLFSDALAGSSFPEAESIVWSFHVTEAEGGVEVEVLSSGYWLGPLAGADRYESSAHPDAEPDEGS